jgi:Zn-dependent protease
MRSALKVFTWFKIPVYIHWTFILIFPFVFWMGRELSLGPLAYFWQSLTILALFACVLLHEFGHSLMARRFGVETEDIILTPIGGIARLERMPEKPRQELLVAIAGPLVNVAIALILLVLCKLIFFSGEIEWWYFKESVRGMLSLGEAESDATYILEDSGIQMPIWKEMLPLMMVINITMVLFNMIPAFPMDGGRVLRALLAMRLGRVKATRVAALLGQAVSVAFVLYGLYTQQFMLALIGFFVFNTARQEDQMVRTDSVLAKFVAKDVVRGQYTRLNASDWMQTPIDLYVRGVEKNFLVFDFNEQLLGYLDEKTIQEVAKKNDRSGSVEKYMKGPAELVRDVESLRYVYYLVSHAKKPIVGVVDADMQMLGVIDASGLENFFAIHNQ